MIEVFKDGLYMSVTMISNTMYEIARFAYTQFYNLDRYINDRPY
jgi:hypothetical protein